MVGTPLFYVSAEDLGKAGDQDRIGEGSLNRVDSDLLQPTTKGWIRKQPPASLGAQLGALIDLPVRGAR
jgi:hypothetical protein